MPSKRRHRHGGFTMIEAALTTVIVGTGVLAMVEAQQAYHKKNDWAQRTGTAMLLANELRELTLPMPMNDPFTGTAVMGPEPDEADVNSFDDVDDFAGVVVAGVGAGTTFSPPINALRQPIANMDRWTQTVNVASVRTDNISSPFPPPLGSTNLMRVTVTVNYLAPNAGGVPTMASQLTWLITQ